MSSSQLRAGAFNSSPRGNPGLRRRTSSLSLYRNSLPVVNEEIALDDSNQASNSAAIEPCGDGPSTSTETPLRSATVAGLQNPTLGTRHCGTCNLNGVCILLPCRHHLCLTHYEKIPPTVRLHPETNKPVCATCGEVVEELVPLDEVSAFVHVPRFSQHLTDHLAKEPSQLSPSQLEGHFLGRSAATASTHPISASQSQVTTPSKLVSPGSEKDLQSPLEALQQSLEDNYTHGKDLLVTGPPRNLIIRRTASASALSSLPPLARFRNPTNQSEPYTTVQTPDIFSYIGPKHHRASVSWGGNSMQPVGSRARGGHAFAQSRSTPDMSSLGQSPSAAFTHGQTMWNTQPPTQEATPDISPDSESSEQAILSQQRELARYQTQNLGARASGGVGEGVIEELNARLPQLSLRNAPHARETFTMGPEHASASVFSTPSGSASRRESSSSTQPIPVRPVEDYEDQNTTPTPAQNHRTEASRLATLIKSGALEKDEADFYRPPVGPRRRQSTHNFQASQVVQYSQTSVDLAFKATTPESEVFFKQLQFNGGQLSLSDAFRLIPFVDKCRIAKPKAHGVVKISNIPFNSTKPEVVAFLGRNARLVQQPPGSPWYAIHLIMERSTAKTNDCYVEFETHDDAVHAVGRFERQRANFKPQKIGDRNVDMELSSQADLMKELFPRAKCVRWEGQDPHIYDTDEPYNSGFKGFVTSEEMVMTAKHAECPQRSPFSHKAYQRTYESMISLLCKYPWWSVGNYKLVERDRIFKATVKTVKALQNHRFHRNPTNPTQLNQQLSQELVLAALHCPGFSDHQKYEVLKAASNFYEDTPGEGTWWFESALAIDWKFKTLSRKDSVGEDILHFFLQLLSDASYSPQHLSLAQHNAAAAQRNISAFGNLDIPSTQDMENMTMAEAAHREWAIVETYLRRILHDTQSTAGPLIGIPFPNA
ncbi:MAG: hypothetical protein M1820_003035 [Bogoriella megaspora]|nr:MAG: hypothetical protein M1820_003035 [Bogoriella megaspora]